MNTIKADSVQDRKKIFAKALIYLLISLAVLTFFSNTINNFTLPKVKVEVPLESKLVKEISGEGFVEAKETIDVFLDGDFAGKIKDIRVEAGDEIEKDSILFVIENDNIEKQLQLERLVYDKLKYSYDQMIKSKNDGSELYNLKSALDLSMNNMNSATREYEVVKSLHESGAKSTNDLWKAEENLKLAEADYKNKEQQYSIAEKKQDEVIKKCEYDIAIQQLKIEGLKEKIELLEVKAPSSGVIDNLNISKGSYVNSSTKLCTIIVKEDGFLFNADINLEDAEYIKNGDSASIKIKALDDEIFKSSIIEIKEGIKPNSQKREILLEIENGNFNGGESGELFIEKDIGNYIFTVSNNAVVQGMSDTQGYLWVIRERKGFMGNEFRAELVEVTILDADNSITAINGNINEDDMIVYKADKPLDENCRVKLELESLKE